MAEFEDALKDLREQYYRQHRQDYYYGAALLRLIEELAPTTVMSRMEQLLYSGIQQKRRSFTGSIIPPIGKVRHEGIHYWNVTPALEDLDLVGLQCHWVLFSNGDLENMSYARYGNRFVAMTGSTNVRKYLHVNERMSIGVIENGYLSLRKFATESGILEADIIELEKELISPREFDNLRRVLTIPISPEVFLPPRLYNPWSAFGMIKY